MFIRIILNLFLLTQLFFASPVFASGGYDNGTAAGKGKLDLDLTINPGDLSNAWPESLDEKGQSYLVWGSALMMSLISMAMFPMGQIIRTKFIMD